MPEPTLYEVSLVFALVTGTCAGVLALLTWRILRESLFGTAVLVLSAVLVLFGMYHAIALLGVQRPLVIRVVKAVMFTGSALFMGLLIRAQSRLQRDARGG